MQRYTTLKLLFLIALAYVFLTQCDSVTDVGEPVKKENPATNPDPNPEASQIEQIADSIRGKQGENANFLITDYFTSEAPFSETEFKAEGIQIKEAGSGIFSISHSDSLFGTHIIDALLINTDADTLEAELFYVIEKDSLAAPDDSSSTGDGEESEAPGNDENEDNGDNGSGDENGGDSGNDDNDGNEDSDEGSAPDSPESPEPTELVIMPLGDSMTNDSRSRVKLWNLLEADGHEIDFVGNQYQESSIPDADHEGVGGIKINEIGAKAASLMKTHKPQYVNLMVGTNDIAWYFDETAEEIAARWNALVQKIYDNSAEGTYVIAATIPPVSSKNVGKSGMEIRDRAEMVKAFNREVRKLVQIRRVSGYNIVLADMEAALDVNRHVSGDGVHLTSEGYAIMGTVYYNAINSVLE